MSSDPLTLLGAEIVRQGQRDRAVILERWQSPDKPDELVELIEAYPEHREWVLKALRKKISKEEGADDGDRQERTLRDVPGLG